ncbi:VPS35 endosomal protein-sorting factor-like [Marchantia polymorpha subsp. ruderalis]|uniref:Uncharacterized protein n=2 Tax=Marchantia polymorpha TaxID=3197 RepID=A0AAF6BTF9_MARPO|nr:hypothetical protein MARPO_0038s0063 [Marchantia polymorpha]BBN15293.1 hypothetical protein Mp_6g18530 [Marchantia polymorpha subsp. ruderalis]|eukprot:PTQ40728.1 hypothetical protein MARPO_0038s0063 [Marchantia polymorpha]
MQIRVRQYEQEAASLALRGKPTTQNPLKSSVTNVEKVSPLSGRINADKGFAGVHQLTKSRTFGSFEDEEKNEKASEDPLEVTFEDPLGVLSSQDSLPTEDTVKYIPRLSRRITKGASDERAEAAAAEWDAYKLSIMQRFTSTGTITVSATFDILSKEPKVRGRSVSAAHLEELENPEKEAREETKIISQQEYVTRLKELNEEISQAWINSERVAALRLSIKVARLLSDTSVPQFYPTLFVLVTDVMDTVGNLVWNRIKKKAECDEDGKLISPLPVNFTAEDVRQEAKDTCFNWFYKIGSIRELLPRIYLELAIVRCMLFLEKDPPISTFQRVTQMMRGLSDPLASAYAHLYLARRSRATMPLESSSSGALHNFAALINSLELPLPSSMPQNPRVYLISGLKDYLILFQRLLAGDFDSRLTKAGADRRLSIILIEPVFEWIMQCLFKQANEKEMAYFLEVFGEVQEDDISVDAPSPGFIAPVSVVVHHLLKNLPATYVGNHALDISKIVKSSIDLSMPQYMNYRLLGLKLCECSPPREFRLTVLNDVWRVVMKYTNLGEYISVADVFVEYILQNCTEAEILIILRDIMRHVKKGEVNDGVLASLESIVFKLVTHYTDLSHVLQLDHFVDILDVFYGDTRISVYKRILSSISRSNKQVRDPVTRHAVFEAARVLHDSLDSLSSDDDRRQITRLIVRYVQLVDFDRDLEQHLAFLVDCRGTFADMDPLRVTVIHASNRLAMTTLKMVKGSHNKRTRDFVKACVTFNEITIPSINSLVTRINLFLETAEVALMNALPSHAESAVKSTLSSLQDVTSKDDVKAGDLEGISMFLVKLSAFLVVMPGHPEHGGFYIVKGLLNVLEMQPWLTPGRRRIQVLSGVLAMLAALAQERLPYHIQNSQVDSNDGMFFGDDSYHEELESLTEILVENITAAANDGADSAQQGLQALDACTALLQVFDANRVGEMCMTLLKKATTSITRNDPYLLSTRQLCQQRGVQLTNV